MIGYRKITCYKYNADGIRTSKTVNGVTTKYTLDGSNVVVETNGTDTIWYYYDASGSLTGFELNGTAYFYVKNMQGDIVAIVNSSGTKVVEYLYDSWGKLISTTGSLASTVGAKNPYRYRGYRYDVETGFYYVSSRYYDSGIGRFINSDDIDLLGANRDFASLNLFAYCGNNPIARKDTNGCFWTAIGIGFVAGIVGQYASDVLGNIQSGKTGFDIFTPSSSASDYLASGIGGAIASIPGLNLLGTITVGAFGNVISEGIKGNINSWGDFCQSFVKGGLANGVGYGIAKGMAVLKVKQINNMPRPARKVFLRDRFYCNSQKNVNVNLKTFEMSTMSENIRIVEQQFTVFRAGIYSSIVSSVAALF